MSGQVFAAGESVPPGRYRRVGGWREVQMPKGGALPPSFDGQVALYQRAATLEDAAR